MIEGDHPLCPSGAKAARELLLKVAVVVALWLLLVGGILFGAVKLVGRMTG